MENNKMKLGDMYGAALTIILLAILLGVGLTVLYTLGGNGAVGSTGGTAINDSAVALAGFVTWFSIIVVIIAAAIIINLVVKSFSGGGR